MELVKPELGLIFWMLFAFGGVLYILRKFAWKPILQALKNREQTIRESLETAQKARDEIEWLKNENQKMILEAKKERDAMLKEAKDIKLKIMDEARKTAAEEAQKLRELAKEQIQKEKADAVDDIKKTIAALSVDIAARILQHELSGTTAHTELINTMLSEQNIN